MIEYQKSTDHKLDSDSGASAPPPNTPDGDVTPATPSQAETGDPRRKAPRSKKAKPRSADKPAPESARFEKLPFPFADQGFSEAIFAEMQAACQMGPDQFDGAAILTMMSVMFTQKPTDPFELMLLHHMAGLHGLIMHYMGSLRTAKHEAQVDLYERTLNRLARTFAGDVEIWNRWYRKRASKD
jgi:hypothetical protein